MTNEEFTAIVEETKAVVISAIRAHLFEHYRHAVDDVAQEVYLRAYRSLVKGGFEKRAKLSTWLYTIARNESIRMNYRLKRAEQKKDFLFFGVADAEESGAYELAPELREKLPNMIGRLPLRFRTIMLLYSEGIQLNEIAAKLSLPPGTVKSRIHKAKKLLRASFSKDLGEGRNE